jgi:hypothetical protein
VGHVAWGVHKRGAWGVWRVMCFICALMYMPGNALSIARYPHQ